VTKTTERRPGRQLRHGLLLASTALVAPLFITIASPAAAQQAGGQGGNASAGINPGGGGSAGQSGNGIVIGTNGGNGANGGGGFLGGAGGISDWGGGGGSASGRAAGGGGGGAGGAGHVINTDATTVATTNISGASGGNGGHASSIGSGSNGGRGGGGGGGGGGSGIYVTSPGTDATITVEAGVTVQGGNGGAGGDGNSTNGSATSDGGRGGNGGHGITVNSMTEHVTINNSGTISGGVGGSGGYGTTGIRNSAGEKGSGIIGSNVAITNNATGIIKPGNGAVPVDYTNTGSVNNAITITGGTNSIVNKGSINGRIELGGASTTTISGTYSNALKIQGLSTMTVTGPTSAGDATGFTTIQNGGTIDIGAGRKVSATGEIGNGPGGAIKIGANATLSGGGSNFYNNGTVDVAAGGTFSNAGSIDNYGGTINFNGAGAKMIAGNGSITNWGQINVTAGDVTVTGSFDNSNGGKISLIGGNMSGVTTLDNGAGGTVDVGAGRTLSVVTFNSTAGSTTGSGTINASDAINLSSGTYGTVFAGTGDLTKSGSGRVTLTGENTYSGGTTIEAGILEIGNGGTSGSIIGNVANSGTLAFNRSNNSSFSGTVTGTGNVTKAGAGTLTVTGSLSHSGGTTISAGTLEIGNGGTSGSLSGNVSNSGTLAFNRSDNIDFGGIVSGTGDVVKKGAGTLTLTGASTYSGDTLIQEGTLKLGTGGSLAASTDVNVAEDAVFDLNSHAQTVASLRGTGEVKLGASGALTVDLATTADFGGEITGGGSFTKAGAGYFVLTGANTYTGGTTISGGKLQIGSGGTTGSITGDVTNNGELIFNRSNDLDFDGDITGSGKLIQSGGGVLTLTGENTYGGGTKINSGTVQIGDGGTSGSITGNVENGGTLAFNRSDDIEFAGVITGLGGLIKDGGGTLTLTGANYFKGDTEIKNGTLQVGDGGTSGQITGNVINDGTLIFNRSDDIDFGSEISGSGDLVKDGDGVLTLRGDATHTGGTTIKSGTLQIGNGGVAGTLSGDVVNDGALAFYRTDNVEFEGDISGSGSLVQKGRGVLTLTGSATHTGGTTIETGTLRIGDGGTTGSISGDIVNDSALVFDRSDNITYADEISGSGSVTQQGTGTLTLTGTNTYLGGTTVSKGTLEIGNGGETGSIVGDVTNNATLAFNRSNDLTFGGVVSGTGDLVKKGGGTLTLTGANTYTGDTKIAAGTLKLGTGGSLAKSTDIDVSSGAIFDVNGHAQTVGTISGAGEIKLGAKGELTVDFTSKDATFAGAITGGGSLVKTGAFSKLILTGDNTYTGGTTIEEGVLQVGNGTTGSISGDIVNNATLFFGRNNAMTYDGDISGTGEIRKYGSGVLTLTGTLTHTGGTEIADGTLKVGNGSTTGSISDDIRNDSKLVFDRSDEITYADDITGRGSLTQAGAGTLILTGANNYSGGTTISAGTLQIGNGGKTGSITGDVANDGTLVFKRIDDIAFGGDISGTGKLVKEGANKLTLTGANSFTGGTTIKGGALAVGDGGTTGSLSGAVVNDGELIFNRSDAISFAGAISGTGSLTKLGDDVLTLTGVNSYGGGTTITEGTVKGTAQSFGTGRIDNDAALIIDGATNASFANAIEGEGSFTKTGAGMLTLTGTSGLTGATKVSAGTLSVAGSLLGSTVTIAEGATLSGTGRIGGLVVAGDGILATGNSIGTLIVEGDATFKADSIFRVEVDETGKADKLEVTGDVTIEGGTVDVRAGAGSYGRLTSYTILTGKSITGEFSDVTSNLAFLDASLSYGTGTSVVLELERNNISFGEVARTRNQRATAAAAEKLGDRHAVFDAILDLNEDMARQAFDSLSGEVHASVQGMLLMDSHFTRDAALERLRTASGGAASDSVPMMALAALPDSGVSLWGTGFGSWGKTDSDGNAAGFSRTAGGFIAGADAAAGKNLRFGAFTGYTQSSFNASDRDSKGDASSYHAGLYAGGNWGGFGLSAGASYSWSDIDTSRDIDFGGLEESLDGDYTAGTTQAFGEAAYRFGTDGFALEPFAGLAYVSLDTDDVDEDGGAAALTVQGDTQALTFSTLGLRAEGSFAIDDVTLTMRGMGGWRHAEGDLTPLIDVSFGDAPGFSIAGAPVAKDTAVFEAGFDLTLGASTKLGVAYMGEIGRDAEQHSGQASFAVDF
jgi:autotransporter-associated beta strand protein